MEGTSGSSPSLAKVLFFILSSRSIKDGVTWVFMKNRLKKLVCEVTLSGWTEDGIIRQPVFLRLREDKAAREVVREKPEGKQQGTS